MIEQNTKTQVKHYFNSWRDNVDTIKEINKSIKVTLKNNVDYQALLLKKKELDDLVKAMEEGLVGNLIDEKKSLGEENKTIIGDTAEALLTDKAVVKDVFKYAKIKWDKQEDMLNDVTTNYVEVFDIEDDKNEYKNDLVITLPNDEDLDDEGNLISNK